MKNYTSARNAILLKLSISAFWLISACSSPGIEQKANINDDKDTIEDIALLDSQGKETLIYINKKNGDTLEIASSFLDADGTEKITYKKRTTKIAGNPTSRVYRDTIQQVTKFDKKGEETVLYIHKQSGDTITPISSFDATGLATITFKKKDGETILAQNRKVEAIDTIGRLIIINLKGNAYVYYHKK